MATAAVVESQPSVTAPALGWAVRVQLSVLMFLQFAVWGAWANSFYDYLQKLAYSSEQAGWLTANMALGAVLASLAAGAIADRLMNAERLMGLCHLIGAALLYFLAELREPGQYAAMFALTLGYALVFNPTLVLANAVAFRHVPDGTRDFPGVRVLGTVGWIVAGLTVGRLYASGTATAADTNGPILLAAGLSAVLGVYCFTLPKTPPTGRAGAGVPVVRAFGLFADPSFAVFFVASLVISVTLAFYFNVAGRFLDNGVGIKDYTSAMTVGQGCELLFLPLLPLFLRAVGMKWVLAAGMFCWGLRYLLFSQAGQTDAGWVLAMLGVALHGFCFDFFLAAGFVHCDNEAPADIRASAQALFSFLTYGVGLWVGGILAGVLEGSVTTVVDGSTVIDWRTFWLVPAAGVLTCLAVFVVVFRPNTRAE